MPDAALFAAVAGTVVGLGMGLTGAGGGVLAVPALTLGLGLAPSQAVPLGLLAIASSALLGSLDGLRRGLVRYRAALCMAAVGMFTAVLGGYLARALSGDALMLAFSLVLMFSALRQGAQVLAPESSPEGPASAKPCRLLADGRFCWTPSCFLHFGAIGGMAGLLSGMLGVGGGFLIVPCMRRYCELGMQGVVATSLAVIALVSLAGVGQAVHAGVTLSFDGLAFILACVLGMLAARGLAPRLSPRALQLGFALLAAGVAIALGARSVTHLFA